MMEEKSLMAGIRWRISDEKKRELRNSLEKQNKK
jgi:hypothetical protein